MGIAVEARPLVEVPIGPDNRITDLIVSGASSLRATYSDGAVFDIDFSALLRSGGVMRPLAEPNIFSQVQIIRNGRALEFLGHLDFCADALRLDAELALRGLTREDVEG
jgi:hypothetical protein